MAVHHLNALGCGCGCGQDMDVAHDPATQGRWQPEVVTCYAGQAKREFVTDNQEELRDSMVVVRLLPEGEHVRNPLAFDPEQAAREQAELRGRLGLD